MKVVILAGGLGTRISEESHLKPKPMIEIGGKPILWHIMKAYSHYGYNEFIICSGYKQNVIKDWFAHYFMNTSDITFDFNLGNKVVIHNRFSEPWKVTVVDTGLNTGTGGRIKRVKNYIGSDTFFMTYGDGVSDVNIKETLEFHQKHGKIATITAVHPDSRFGVMEIRDHQIVSFREKSPKDTAWINGGFMVLEPKIIDYIEDDQTMLEGEPFEIMCERAELMCYKHNGFWQCMDTLRDREKLEALWAKEQAPWKLW